MLAYQVSRTMAVIALVGLIGVVAVIAISSHFVPPIFTASSATTTVTSTASVYLLSAVGPCKGPGGYTPCFGGDFTQAEIFNCANAAAASSGCMKQIANPSNPQMSYQITVWYPYVGHSDEPSPANCMYESSGDPGHFYYAHCLPLNSTSFVVTEPSPPPL